MTGQILIVDDLSLNRTVLRAKLGAACYRTISAAGGDAALQMARSDRPDLVLLDYHMPDMDGIAVCKRLRADPATRDIPIILFSASSDRDHRLNALQAGADDFLPKPLDEAYLLGRIRSLLRASATRDEWRDHPNAALRTGMAEPPAGFAGPVRMTVLVGDDAQGATWCSSLADIWPRAHIASSTPARALADGAGRVDLYLVAPDALSRAGLHIIAELRSRAATRAAEICLLLPDTTRNDGAMALDLGAADVLSYPLDAAEARLRLDKVIRRKHQRDAQRRVLETQLDLATTDPLTGLHNRHHAMTRLAHIATAAPGGCFALLMVDLDHFKAINDEHGHSIGDDILCQVAARMRSVLRKPDLLCRYGGEEFLIALPGAGQPAARQVAARLCEAIGAGNYRMPGGALALHVTASVGLALHTTQPAPLAPDALRKMIDAADAALRDAKTSGRNRVVAAHSAIA